MFGDTPSSLEPSERVRNCVSQMEIDESRFPDAYFAAIQWVKELMAA